METNNRKTFLFFCSLLFGLTFLKAQVETKLIKLVQTTHYGTTDTIDLMPILVNINGNVVISGNQKMSASQYDAATISAYSNGITAWMNAYNPTGEKAFITASCNDSYGNVYNVGAIRTSISNGTDFLIVKLDINGIVQWSYTWDNGMNDGASAICIDDATGEVYVTGATEGPGFVDYATIKLNPSGSLAWTQLYDYAGTFDIPTAISKDPGGSQIRVTGSSGSTFNDWDFATVIYDANTGAQMAVERNPNSSGTSQDKAFAMSTDSQGNTYILGTTYKTASKYDVQIVKLDANYSTLFVNTFDGHGFDDAGVNLTIDGNDNVYIVGTSYVTATKKELLVMKYDKNGNLKWTFKRQAHGGQDADGLRIKMMSSNEIFIGANYGSGNSQDIALLCLDSLGKLSIEKTFDGSGFKDRLMDFAIDGDRIYVSARTTTASLAPVENNISIQYRYKNFAENVTTIGTGVSQESYVDNEVIISFNKKAVKLSAINNKEMTFGKLEDFVQDSTCHKIRLQLDPDSAKKFDPRKLSTRKIFFELTEADSLSETRMGNYVKVPEFYTSLVVTLPSVVGTTWAINPLNKVEPDIRYAQLNNVYRLASPPTPPVTNDPEYTLNQGSLHPVPLYPNASINADTAWAVNTGTASIRAAILDSGIQPGHPDLAPSIPGFDFCANAPLANGDTDNHGTPVGGVIGAIRNNGIGVSGLAGGDATSGIAGVTLYDCKTSANAFVTDAWATAGFLKAASGTNMGGFAAHLCNIGWFFGGAYDVNNWGHGVCSNMIEQMNFANRNGVAVQCPKANFNNLGTNIFPADWSDEIIMSCGSSGTDGEHCQYQVNCTNASTNWGQIDFVAPGTEELVKVTSSAGTYIKEDGTSFATPHVSGAVAIMMSYRNSSNPSWNNMVHEDCEQILQLTATDCTNSAAYPGTKVGYDTLTGYGRINVYKAIKAINKNYYRFRHITETIGSTSTSGALTNNILTDTMTWTNFPGVPTGTYVTEVYKRTTIVNFALLPGESIVGYWPLNKESYGAKFYPDFVDYERPYYCHIDGMSTSSATLTTHYYKIPSLNVYMPYSPSQIKSAFTLYTYDATGAVGIKENASIINYQNFKVFPNPHNGQCNVEFASDMNENLTYKLVNVLGQVSKTGVYAATLGINTLKINTSELTTGIYILSIFNSNQELYKQKIIKE